MLPVGDVSTEYDADMSASLEATQVDPDTLDVRPEVQYRTTSSPSSSQATEVDDTETETQPEAGPSSQVSEDVFGSSSVPVVTARQTKRKARKASRGMSSPWLVLGQVPRLTTVAATSGRKRKAPRTRAAAAAEIEAEADTEVEIEVASTPTPTPTLPEPEPKDEPEAEVAPVTEDDTLVVQETPAPAPVVSGSGKGKAKARASANNSGLLQHASRWVSGLTTFGGLFSPKGVHGPRPDTPHSADGASPRAGSSRKRKTPTQLTRSISEPQLQLGSPAKRAKKSKSAANSPRTKSEVIMIYDSDEEDELLLSPESALRREAEERAALAGEFTLHGTNTRQGADCYLARPELRQPATPTASQNSSGRFDGKFLLLLSSTLQSD